MLIQGDARVLPLTDACVQTVITSPPYYGLRNYGHDAQLGLETTPSAYVASLVAVFREIWRVLRDDGTLWLNLGDSYANDTKWGGASGGKHVTALHGNTGIGRGKKDTGLKSKDLIGIPWRVAFALQADGWYLRSDIIWSKPNPMPESVTDRPTKAHEYLFLLSKSERYFYDAPAIAEPFADERMGNPGVYRAGLSTLDTPHGIHGKGVTGQGWTRGAELNGRNRRSVWEIPTQPYAGAHFATFPEALVEPCVLAGSRLGDVVLDPFCGSGTVPFVAERLSRRWVGIDLAYQGLASERTQQRGIQFT